MTEAQNVVVRLKSYLLKEKETWKGILVEKAANILKKMANKSQSKVKKAYKDLYTRNLTNSLRYEDIYGEASPIGINYQKIYFKIEKPI